MIGIINYGSGNVHAIANLHKRANIDYFVSSDKNELKNADKLILPGVGAFDDTMNMLKNNDLFDFLNEEVIVNKKKILGICVGMQILGDSSEEGLESGFGWIKGKIKKINTTGLITKPHLPHLGWNDIEVEQVNDLFLKIDLQKGFYFLHSYYFENDNKENILASVNYGGKFACCVNFENIYGAQFHPEKSHENGIQFFKNFANL